MKGELPEIESLRCHFAPRASVKPEVLVTLLTTAEYDELLEAA